MSKKLFKALRTQKETTQQIPQEIYGTLGIPIDGGKHVEVPNRPSFVYVQLRDNQNEVIQAFNNKVAASYGLPVIVTREGNRYVIQGVNTQRYQDNWNNYSPYLPKHGTAHSFADGGGGDVTWIFSRQFMPNLVYPNDGGVSGTSAYIAPHILLNNAGTWTYTGATGTPNLLGYKGTGSSSAMLLIYLDANTGNPGVLVGSGSYFPNTLTGTATIFPYIPTPNRATQIPLAAVRMDTGTANITWDNLYDVRQWIHATPSGTNSGGGGSAYDDFWNSGTAGQYSIRAKNPTNPNAVGDYAFAIGQNTYASGTSSVAEGSTTEAVGIQSHAEGVSTLAFGGRSHAEGFLTRAYGTDSHAEGNSTVASGTASFAGGQGNHAIANQSAALGGLNNRVSGLRSVILGGNNYSGTYNDTVFVPQLNIYTLSSGTPVTNLGINDIGMVVSGTSSAISSHNTLSGLQGGASGEYYHLSSGTFWNTEAGNGWKRVTGTWAFHSQDAPSYVISSALNVTGTVGVGMKFQLTHQSQAKNFIVTAVGITGSTTYLNLYGGTDYTLNVTGSISQPLYSTEKSPFGFPAQPSKWTVFATDNSNASQASPSGTGWYNLGSISASMPIGAWDVSYKVVEDCAVLLAGNLNSLSTLSTNSFSETNTEFTLGNAIAGTASTSSRFPHTFPPYPMVVTSKTLWRLLGKTNLSGVASISFRGDLFLTVIQFKSAYL